MLLYNVYLNLHSNGITLIIIVSNFFAQKHAIIKCKCIVFVVYFLVCKYVEINLGNYVCKSYTSCMYNDMMHSPYKYIKISVFALTHLPKARDKKNWIRTSENYERICLNKFFFFFLNLAFEQVGEN